MLWIGITWICTTKHLLIVKVCLSFANYKPLVSRVLGTGKYVSDSSSSSKFRASSFENLCCCNSSSFSMCQFWKDHQRRWSLKTYLPKYMVWAHTSCYTKNQLNRVMVEHNLWTRPKSKAVIYVELGVYTWSLALPVNQVSKYMLIFAE